MQNDDEQCIIESPSSRVILAFELSRHDRLYKKMRKYFIVA